MFTTALDVLAKYPTHEKRLEECKRLCPDFVIATETIQGEKQRVARYRRKGYARGLRARFDERVPATMTAADRRLVNGCLLAILTD